LRPSFDETEKFCKNSGSTAKPDAVAA
jgi:hypothetical protein